ncbi:MAG: hypothetical protein AAGK74_08180 [Chloroflexota bacterium]
MWTERLLLLFRFPSPYDGDHANDPLFKYEARQAAMVGSPEALRKFNRQFSLSLGGGLIVLLPLLLLLVAPPIYDYTDFVPLFILVTIIVWAISFLFDGLHMYFAANSMVTLKTNGSLPFIRATPLSPQRLLIVRYQIALLNTWRVFWVSVIIRYVLVLMWLPLVVYSVFTAARRLPLEPLTAVYWLTAIIVGYAGGSYVAIREPLWRWRIMASIGLRAAIEHPAQGAVIVKAVLYQVGFGLVRYVLISLGAYGVIIGVTVLYAIGIWIADALFAINAGLFSVIFIVPLTAAGVLLPAWIYRFVIVLNRDWHSSSEDALRYIRMDGLLDRDE